MGQFHRRLAPGGLLCHLFFAAFSVCFILPVVLVVVISFSSTESINQLGFSLFPKAFSLEAYQYIFKTPRLILLLLWYNHFCHGRGNSGEPHRHRHAGLFSLPYGIVAIFVLTGGMEKAEEDWLERIPHSSSRKYGSSQAGVFVRFLEERRWDGKLCAGI